jgi:hypothetical protein
MRNIALLEEAKILSEERICMKSKRLQLFDLYLLLFRGKDRIYKMVTVVGTMIKATFP